MLQLLLLDSPADFQIIGLNGYRTGGTFASCTTDAVSGDISGCLSGIIHRMIRGTVHNKRKHQDGGRPGP